MKLEPRFPPVLDNTIVSTFASCPMKVFNEHLLGLSGSESIDLVAGSAFAKGCEVARRAFGDGASELDALAWGVRALTVEYGDIDIRTGADDPASRKYIKSYDRVLDAFLAYFGQIPLPAKCTTSGVHRLPDDPYKPAKLGDRIGVEFSSVVPIGRTNPQTGDELVYSIRFDALCDSPFGLVGLDEKTAGSLDKNWSAQWNLRSQFLNYIKVTQLSGFDMRGLVIRGVVLQKTQFHFPEALILPPQAVVDRCWNDTMHRIDLMIHYWNQGYWPSAFGSACNEYGGCPFRDLCGLDDPEPWYGDFNVSYWNPVLARREWLRRNDIEPGLSAGDLM